MRYLGGKHRQGQKIAELVTAVLKDGQRYYEPFCGAMGVATRVVEIDGKRNPLHLSDLNPALITMWTAVLEGWEPPTVVDEPMYNALKKVQDPNDPMTAFAGFGCAFAGQWFATYARDKRNKKTNFAANARRSIIKKALILLEGEVTLKAAPYDEVVDKNAVFYLDPPYAGRYSPWNGKAGFDYDDFWTYARFLTEHGNRVFVTEFNAPPDFVAVHSFGDTVVRHYAGADKAPAAANECVFVHESQV